MGDAVVQSCAVGSHVTVVLQAMKAMRRRLVALSMLWSSQKGDELALKANALVQTGAKQAMCGFLQKQPENPLSRGQDWISTIWQGRTHSFQSPWGCSRVEGSL